MLGAVLGLVRVRDSCLVQVRVSDRHRVRDSCLVQVRVSDRHRVRDSCLVQY